MTRRTRKHGRGAPDVFTPTLQARFLAAVAEGVPEEKAAADVGVSSRTVRWRAQHDPNFADALDQIRARLRDERMPHDATRYRKLKCRCDDCTTDESAKRMARRDRQRARERGEEEPAGAEVHHLPVPAAGPPPLAAAGF